MIAHLIRKLLVDDQAQDVVEYALLVTFVGLAGVGAWLAIQGAVATAYTGWNSAVYNLWETPAPSGS